MAAISARWMPSTARPLAGEEADCTSGRCGTCRLAGAAPRVSSTGPGIVSAQKSFPAPLLRAEGSESEHGVLLVNGGPQAK